MYMHVHVHVHRQLSIYANVLNIPSRRRGTERKGERERERERERVRESESERAALTYPIIHEDIYTSPFDLESIKVSVHWSTNNQVVITAVQNVQHVRTYMYYYKI